MIDHGQAAPASSSPVGRPARVAVGAPAVGALALGTVAIAVAYASAFRTGGAPGWAAWLMTLGVPTTLVATMALGAARGGRVPASLLLALGAVGLMLAGGFALALALPADLGAAEPLWLGLPRRAAVIVYGIGLLPVVVLPLVYALTFDAQTLRKEDLERVLAMGRARRAGVSPEAPDGGGMGPHGVERPDRTRERA